MKHPAPLLMSHPLTNSQMTQADFLQQTRDFNISEGLWLATQLKANDRRQEEGH